jgi:alkanesulfonate monooxygenase SsuD/methylene tetrahydromethanopterin reductase-like flavin-dependent oxidoreductase (luciferase family)
MRFGVHLPLIDLGGDSHDLESLGEYVETAVGLGFDAVAANDHLVFGAPWLDGPTALAAIAGRSGRAQLVTTVLNPVVRGAVPSAKLLATLDVLSRGRVVAGLGPGSSAADYEAVGLPFEERWPRFDEAVRAVRSLLRDPGTPLEPRPWRPGGPPVWIASWGSAAGLRRAARLGDGWLASAYNTTPAAFAAGGTALRDQVARSGRDPDAIDTAIATLWFHLDEAGSTDSLHRLATAVRRSPGELRSRLAFGSTGALVDLLGRYADAGVQRVLVWPVTDHLEQLHRFADAVPDL